MRELRNILGAVYRKDRSVLETLSPAELNLRDDDGRTPLMHAVLADDAEPAIVKLLIDGGAHVDTVDDGERWSALHFAARDQKHAIVRVLLDAGAAVDAANALGNTPLWQSVMVPNPTQTVAKELIDNGADPFRKNNAGVAPVDVARTTGNAELVRLFTEGSHS
jgi:ankyrin repeat protein